MLDPVHRHNQRPQFLAAEVLKFINEKSHGAFSFFRGFSNGDKQIGQINFDIATGTVTIRCGINGPTVVLATYSAGDNRDYTHAKLVFNQYGNHFFLSQVWPAGATGRGLRKSRQEVEMAKATSRPEVLSVISGGTSR